VGYANPGGTTVCWPSLLSPLLCELGRGEGRHLLVGVILQASQVEVGISREETGNNAGPIRESQTGSGSEHKTGVGYGIRDIRSNGSDQVGDLDWRKTHKLNEINRTI
jgi:hypothetical protein